MLLLIMIMYIYIYVYVEIHTERVVVYGGKSKVIGGLGRRQPFKNLPLAASFLGCMSFHRLPQTLDLGRKVCFVSEIVYFWVIYCFDLLSVTCGCVGQG